MAGETKEKRKRVTFQDENEHTERRRSSRIIILEEKKSTEKGRRMALALERKNNSANHGSKIKDKGKAKIGEVDGLKGFNKTEGQQIHNGSASSTNVHYVPTKEILRNILDCIQREEDPNELFAEPDNLEHKVENQCPIVKQPMDFATMRAKLHENLYTSLEQFKRDMLLMCSNAVTTNPTTSRKHKVAKAISARARKLFDELSAKIQRCQISQWKESASIRSQESQPTTSKNARVPRKPTGRKNAKTSKTNKRDTYRPPTNNSSIVTEFLNVNKLDIQLTQDASKYKESLMKFVEDLGPIAKKVAAKKLEALNSDQQLKNSEMQSHDHVTPSSNRPLRILGTSSTEGNKNLSITNFGGTNDNGRARADHILGNVFLNHSDKNKGGISNINGYDQSPNATRGITIDNVEDPSNKGKMVVSQLGNNNVLPPARPLQKGSGQNQNNSRAITVWPTVVIPNNFQPLFSGSPKQIQHRAAPYNVPPPTTLLPNLQMPPIIRMNVPTPCPHQETRSSPSTTLQTPLGGALNQEGGGGIWLSASKL